MTTLQKESLIELAFVVIGVFVLAIFISVLAKDNVQGLVYIGITVVLGGAAGAVGVIFNSKRLKKLDERQLAIKTKASMIAAYVFVIYILALSLITFFLIGGGGKIYVSYLPVGAFIGVFAAQLTETLILFYLDSVE